MTCPACGCPQSEIIDSRQLKGGKAYRRRRWCERMGCGKRWTTLERVAKNPAFSIVQRTQPVVSDTASLDTTGCATSDTTGGGNGHNGSRSLEAKHPTSDCVAAAQPVVPGGGVGGGLPSGPLRSQNLFPDLSDPPPAGDLEVDRARARRAKRLAKLQAESPAFAAFYAAYPRKVGRDKAWAAWKAHELEGKADSVMAGLAWQVEVIFSHAPWDKIPHPATWLGGRWKDVRPTAAQLQGRLPPTRIDRRHQEHLQMAAAVNDFAEGK